jgi:hypothetical protein
MTRCPPGYVQRLKYRSGVLTSTQLSLQITGLYYNLRGWVFGDSSSWIIRTMYEHDLRLPEKKFVGLWRVMDLASPIDPVQVKKDFRILQKRIKSLQLMHYTISLFLPAMSIHLRLQDTDVSLEWAVDKDVPKYLADLNHERQKELWQICTYLTERSDHHVA